MTTPYAPQPVVPAKNPHRYRGWFWVLAIVGIIVIAVATHGGGDPDGATGATPSTGGPASSEGAAPAPADDPLTDDGWTASDIQIETTAIGPSISARITNNEADTRTGVFTLTVFSGGERVYDAVGSASDVEAGGTATVTFVSTSPDAIPGDPATFTYELQSDI